MQLYIYIYKTIINRIKFSVFSENMICFQDTFGGIQIIGVIQFITWTQKSIL